jgi:hypothetical protein
MTTQTGWPAACRPPVTVPSWLQRCVGRRRCCRRGEEREGGGGEEACIIPGGGEEDEDRGREVHGGVDEAQRRREEEEGGSVGGRDPDRVPGAGASLGVVGDSDGWGPDDRTADAPPIAFRKGGVFLPPPVDRRGPVDGNDSDGEDKKWTSNMSY